MSHHMNQEAGHPHSASSPVALEKLRLLDYPPRVLEDEFEKEAGREADQRDPKQQARRRPEESMVHVSQNGSVLVPLSALAARGRSADS